MHNDAEQSGVLPIFPGDGAPTVDDGCHQIIDAAAALQTNVEMLRRSLQTYSPASIASSRSPALCAAARLTRTLLPRSLARRGELGAREDSLAIASGSLRDPRRQRPPSQLDLQGQQTVSSCWSAMVPVVVPGVHVSPTTAGLYFSEPSGGVGPPVAAQPPSTPTEPTCVMQASSE